VFEEGITVTQWYPKWGRERRKCEGGAQCAGGGVLDWEGPGVKTLLELRLTAGIEGLC
jgi:hypothetical protein